MTEYLSDCIYRGTNIHGDPVCILGRKWSCETDATICGDTCPDYQGEKK